MAANSHSRGLIGIGKRFVNQIRTGATSSDPTKPLLLRRAVHESVYDKNLDDHVRPAVVPDELIQPQSDKYWAPHPKTGVFGPESKENSSADLNSSPSKASEESVLEQKAFFRPLEDLEKPLQ